MKHLKLLPILFLTFLTVFTSCKKDDIEEPDNLEQYNILGKWKLQSRTICGITDMIVLFDTMEFTTGSESDDLRGNFMSKSAGTETNGQFEIDPENRTIRFDYNNTQKTWEFQMSEDALTFTYFEDNCEFITVWQKEE